MYGAWDCCAWHCRLENPASPSKGVLVVPEVLVRIELLAEDWSSPALVRRDEHAAAGADRAGARSHGVRRTGFVAQERRDGQAADDHVHGLV